MSSDAWLTPLTIGQNADAEVTFFGIPVFTYDLATSQSKCNTTSCRICRCRLYSYRPLVLYRGGQRYPKMYRLKRYRHIFEKKIDKSDTILLAKIFFTDEAIEKTKQKFFLHRWSDTIYQGTKISPWSDTIAVHSRKCIDYSILKIVSIKATECSSQFGGKIGDAEEKSLAP